MCQIYLKPLKILYNSPVFYLLKQATFFCSDTPLFSHLYTLNLEVQFKQELRRGTTSAYPHPAISGAEVCKWYSSGGFLGDLQQFSKCSIKESLRIWTAEFQSPPFHSPAVCLRKILLCKTGRMLMRIIDSTHSGVKRIKMRKIHGNNLELCPQSVRVFNKCKLYFVTSFSHLYEHITNFSIP